MEIPFQVPERYVLVIISGSMKVSRPNIYHRAVIKHINVTEYIGLTELSGKNGKKFLVAELGEKKTFRVNGSFEEELNLRVNAVIEVAIEVSVLWSRRRSTTVINKTIYFVVTGNEKDIVEISLSGQEEGIQADVRLKIIGVQEVKFSKRELKKAENEILNMGYKPSYYHPVRLLWLVWGENKERELEIQARVTGDNITMPWSEFEKLLEVLQGYGIRVKIKNMSTLTTLAEEL